MSEIPPPLNSTGSSSTSWHERVDMLRQKANIKALPMVLGTGFSLLLLWLAFRDVPFSQIMDALGHVDWRFVILALGLVLAGTLARAARWKLLYHPETDIPFFRLTRALFVGQMLNIAAPARIGEVARIYFVDQMETHKWARTLGTIAAEKLLDILALLVLLFLVPVSVSLPAWFQDARTSFVVLALVFFGMALILFYSKERLLAWLGSTLRFLPENWRARLREAIDLSLKSLDALRSPWVGLQLQGWSFIIWGMGVLVNYIVFLALDLYLPFSAALFLLIVLQVGIAVPSVPGKLGVFQYLCILALAPFGVDKSMALTYSVLLYLIGFGPLLVLGAFFIWWESLRKRRMKPAG